MKQYFLNIYHFILSNWSEFLVFLFFGISFLYSIINIDDLIDKNDPKSTRELIVPIITYIGLFLAYLQYLSSVHSKKKEAALTYFPEPLNIQNIENEIDKVINFWSSRESMDSYVVKLLLGDELINPEYNLIWNKISIDLKQNIISNAIENENFNDHNRLEHHECYNKYIQLLYSETRRKLNAYLNQLERYCLAVNNGSINSNAAKKLWSYKFERHYFKARPYIDRLRERSNQKGIYIEIESTLKNWGVI